MIKPTLKTIFVVSFVCAAFGSGCKSEQNSVKSEMQSLQGTWQLVYQQVNGKKVPDESAAKMFHGTMAFTGDKIRYAAELPGFDFTLMYDLHPNQQPKGIDLRVTDSSDKEGIGQKTIGIYDLQDGNLQICHSKIARPARFTAEEGSHNVLIVLKRPQ